MNALNGCKHAHHLSVPDISLLHYLFVWTSKYTIRSTQSKLYLNIVQISKYYWLYGGHANSLAVASQCGVSAMFACTVALLGLSFYILKPILTVPIALEKLINRLLRNPEYLKGWFSNECIPAIVCTHRYHILNKSIQTQLKAVLRWYFFPIICCFVLLLLVSSSTFDVIMLWETLWNTSVQVCFTSHAWRIANGNDFIQFWFHNWL